MARWFLVRHGETDWNSEGRVQGQLDTPLNEVGHAQARSLSTRLAPMPFMAAYASDLHRVVETAAPIVQDRNLPLKKLPELREKSFGDWEGMTFREVEARYPDLYPSLFTDDTPITPPGGESDLQLYERVKAVAERLQEAHANPGGNILVVAHGGTLRALIAYLLGLSAKRMWRFRFANAGISVVSVFENGSAVLDLLNDTSHLGESFGN